MSITRKSVTILAERKAKLGPIHLILIVYVDGRESYGVSGEGSLTLFGTDKARAEKYYEVA